MKAILSFKKPDKTTDTLSGISQKEGVGSHILNKANDFMGLNKVGNCYLKAPYDCVVKAIATVDGTVFFESTCEVETPIGKFDHCWFMATHMLKADRTALGIKVGKTFKQGEICYREGTQYTTGPHMHIEMGTGKFNGTTCPYYNSKKTFKYNETNYYLMKPYTDGEELSVNKMVYLDNLSTDNVNILKLYSWTFVPKYEKVSAVERDKSVDQVKNNSTCLRVRTGPGTNYESLGVADKGYFNVLETSLQSDYTWYKVGENNWLAGGSWIEFLPSNKEKLKELKAKKKELEQQQKSIQKQIDEVDKQIAEIS